MPTFCRFGKTRRRPLLTAALCAALPAVAAADHHPGGPGDPFAGSGDAMAMPHHTVPHDAMPHDAMPHDAMPHDGGGWTVVPPRPGMSDGVGFPSSVGVPGGVTGVMPANPMRPLAPLAPSPPVSGDPEFGPPRGTLGHTYQRSSRFIPYDEHPRVGMLDLKLPAEFAREQPVGTKIRVMVHDVAGTLKPLEGFIGDDGDWHFESVSLLPTVPHVYRVTVERVHYEAKEIRRYGRLVQEESEVGSDLLGVRFLRLIPGRVVTLTY